jgi:hypothetical protein
MGSLVSWISWRISFFNGLFGRLRQGRAACTDSSQKGYEDNFTGQGRLDNGYSFGLSS